ncbi:glycosyltransferase [Salidesulfovibrio onnuriiensis]|uniref:glycosyltransferase n=1 Tax=Salidesulfovibrio onnuriiensis TaxID=2583823 RepID=UPI0011C725BE|nr:glycosyltransferase [Salidesulfovibrio onnuriiensis]
MKILYLSTLDIMGGAARGAYRLHRSLLDKGVDSTMLCCRKFSDDPTVQGPRNTWELRYWFFRHWATKQVLRMQRSDNPIIHSINLLPTGTHRRVNAFDPDIVQMHWIGSEMINIAEVAQIKRPIVWRLADQWAFSGAEHYAMSGQDERFTAGYRQDNRPEGYAGLDIDRWTWSRKMKHWQDKPMTIITGSKWLAECARRSVLFKNKRVEAVPSGIDVSIYKPLGREQAREILNLPQNKKLILFGALSATSDPRKGFHLLSPALQQVAKAMPGNTEALVLGSSQPVNAPDFGMPVHYIPKLSDDWSLALVYSAADVLVAPSTMDNLPFSVMEAQACGTPCVAFDIGGMPDMIEHDRNGWLATPFKTEELAEGILRPLGDDTLRKQWSKLGRQKAEAEYDVRIQAETYINIYNQILGKQ